MTSFAETIAALHPSVEDRYTICPTDDWRQGRTLFGGLSAALCYAACERQIDDLPPLRSAQIAYIGPSMGAAELRPQMLRRGRSVTFMACDMSGDVGLATRALFCFGGARESKFREDAHVAPQVSRPADCPPLFAGQGPTFTQHIDQRFAGGHRPMTSASEGRMLVWVRMAEAGPPQSIATLLALGDALPPAAMPRLSAPAAISTMTWQIDIVDASRFSVERYCLLESTDEKIGDGYSAQRMTMWNEDGLCILLARQTVAVFG
jgi:acyl-CoA thioesterase